MSIALKMPYLVYPPKPYACESEPYVLEPPGHHDLTCIPAPYDKLLVDFACWGCPIQHFSNPKNAQYLEKRNLHLKLTMGELPYGSEKRRLTLWEVWQTEDKRRDEEFERKMAKEEEKRKREKEGRESRVTARLSTRIVTENWNRIKSASEKHLRELKQKMTEEEEKNKRGKEGKESSITARLSTRIVTDLKRIKSARERYLSEVRNSPGYPSDERSVEFFPPFQFGVGPGP
jgi:hypothetical protein